ncbi:D-alanine--D-alanine ligase [Nocardioides acrostichi]|uniref:D-alanine--D-alanine ligase n=1 Tax=Nocardioides acrostichi TaxID=2784339 RepID=A0A930UZS3_9ACTN|nr:D-alanine--D-alanine ligase [Nocardioides acrostichi]MBF4161102.1 D-alanine--D-alanine ligase [Nocardioides acrostichi]
MNVLPTPPTLPRLRVAVIGGGANGEHDVSLASAASAVEAMAPRHDVVPLTIGRDGRFEHGLARAAEAIEGCDVVLPLLHGPRGEDGTIAALADLAGVPLVGSGLAAGALAMDKHATKLVASAAGVATAPGSVVTAATSLPRPGHAAVVKPVAAGSSLGVTFVPVGGDLTAAVREALRHDSRVLVERAIEGREVDLAVLGRPDGSRYVAPALEIICPGVFDLDTKYDGTADFHVPAALAAGDLAVLEEAALATYDALGCAGLARVDFFLTTDGPVLNEVNTTPGFTAASQAPRMFAAAGLGYADLLDVLLDDALVCARGLAAA